MREARNGLLADSWRHALTGPLGAFRNINKFQPLIRLPLALGLANCLPILATRGVKRYRALATRRQRDDGRSASRRRRDRRRPTGPGAALPARLLRSCPVLLAASRRLPGQVLRRHAHIARSRIWIRLLHLGRPGRRTHALARPISVGGAKHHPARRSQQHPLARWDRATARSACDTFAGRDPGPSRIRLRPGPQRPRQAEFGHAAQHRRGAYRPRRKWAASGRCVRSFGHRPPHGHPDVPQEPTDAGRYPSLEIYALPGANRVDAYPASSLAVLSGGPEALPTLAASGVLGNRPTVLAADLAAGSAGDALLPADLKPTAWIDTDTLTRRDEQYGSLHGGDSYLLAPGAKAAGESTAPQVRLDVDPNGHQTTASLSGVQSVTASHYGFVLGAVPQAGPESAIDGDPTTSWSVSGFPRRNVGQWLQVTFPKAISANHVSVQLLDDSSKRIRITSLRVTTDAGSLQTKVSSGAKPQLIALPAGPTKTLRLTITSVAGGAKSGSYGPGISELTIPGVTIHTGVALPNDVASYFPAGGPRLHLLRLHARSGRSSVQPRSRCRDSDHPNLYGSSYRAVPPFRHCRRPQPSSGEAEKGATVALACGSGPTVSIDGKQYATYVRGARSRPRRRPAGAARDLRLCADHSESRPAHGDDAAQHLAALPSIPGDRHTHTEQPPDRGPGAEPSGHRHQVGVRNAPGQARSRRRKAS